MVVPALRLLATIRLTERLDRPGTRQGQYHSGRDITSMPPDIDKM